MYHFRNDYSEGAHPAVLAALAATNLEGNIGYGKDPYCSVAADLIRTQCEAPLADVQFLIGGTQANFTAICAFLRPWESVICPAGGHINGHEAGAVEATGHKLLQVETGLDGKLTPALIAPLVAAGADEHVTAPRLVYISNATETGGLYTRSELTALSDFCREKDLLLFLDGARLASAFGAVGNDLTLPDLARLCDAFYMGGTKNGALMGEALVIANPALQPGFFRVKKQRGGVLAKGWLLGVQFETLLRDGLYWALGRHASAMAQRLRVGLDGLGLTMAYPSPTNLLFPRVPNSLLPQLEQVCTYEIWDRDGAEHTVIRLVTSFATKAEDVEGLLSELASILPAPCFL